MENIAATLFLWLSLACSWNFSSSKILMLREDWQDDDPSVIPDYLELAHFAVSQQFTPKHYNTVLNLTRVQVARTVRVMT